MSSSGKFIVLEGPEGSGKSTITDYWKDYLTSQGKKVFDLKSYGKIHNKLPEISELSDVDVIISAEPTYTGIGKVIREEFIRKGTHYPTIAIAEAYSLDRLILYTKYYIPLLERGVSIITDRSLTTSLVYQTTTDSTLTYEDILNLPGNTLALEYRPDHFIFLKIDPATALQRALGRIDKQDNAIFEELEFQKKTYEKYLSSEYQNIFTSHGTQIHYLSADTDIDIMKKASLNLLQKILNIN